MVVVRFTCHRHARSDQHFLLRGRLRTNPRLCNVAADSFLGVSNTYNHQRTLMALITINDVSIRFRGPALLDDVSCQIEAGQRIGLLGRNGAGKTTLMKLICGETQPDNGKIIFAPGITTSLLPQDVPHDVSGTIEEVVASGIQESTDERQRGKLSADQIISRMQLEPAAGFATLSSGMKRRVLLARALVNDPDVLMLDEPTNHLDLDAIGWLEQFLLKWRTTLLFVTHDRMFLRKLATRILEIDRGRIFDWSCDYDTFLKRKEESLAAEEKQNALFDKKLAQEEVWIRQGIKARRTRNEGRVRALKRLREEHRERRKEVGRVNLRIQEGQRSGNLVADVKDISFAYEDLQIVEDFSTTIFRGDKVGIIGPNGVGKTTLLRIILGKLQPQSGKVRTGTNLELAYFDQLREQLDETKTVQENVGDGYDTIKIGDNSQHVIGYLQNFLFSPERARTQVKFLSGGERNRILLAKLFAKTANTIVLDEPTNDLDSETLELLEERLADFKGTVLLVSHDREFLNNVVTSTIVFEPTGVREYVGGYDDWLRQRPESAQPSEKPKGKKGKPRTSSNSDAPSDATQTAEKRKLTYKEQRELKSLPAKIEKLETKIEELHAEMADPGYYQKPKRELAAGQAKLKQLEAELESAFERWQELE